MTSCPRLSQKGLGVPKEAGIKEVPRLSPKDPTAFTQAQGATGQEGAICHECKTANPQASGLSPDEVEALRDGSF